MNPGFIYFNAAVCFVVGLARVLGFLFRWWLRENRRRELVGNPPARSRFT